MFRPTHPTASIHRDSAEDQSGVTNLVIREGVDAGALAARLLQICEAARSDREPIGVPFATVLAEQGWFVDVTPAHSVLRADLVSIDAESGLTWTRAIIDQSDFSCVIARPLTIGSAAIAAALTHTTTTPDPAQQATRAATLVLGAAVAAVMVLLPVSAQERWRRCAAPSRTGLFIGHIDQRAGWRLTQFAPRGAVPAWRRYEAITQGLVGERDENSRAALADRFDIAAMAAALRPRVDALRASRTIASRCQQLAAPPARSLTR